MSTYNNLTQRHYQILINNAHDDLNVVHPIFPNLKKYGKEFKLKFLLDRESLLIAQNWLEVIQNVIKATKYFVMLLSKKTNEKNRYVQVELLTQWKDFSRIKSSGMI
jgi:hypothetical protein